MVVCYLDNLLIVQLRRFLPFQGFCQYQFFLTFLRLKGQLYCFIFMNKPIAKKIIPIVNQIFPDQDLKHKYKVKKIIGKGQYGYVAKAVDKKTNEFVAIKKLINVFQNQFQTKRILRQIVLLKNCKHPNIVSLIEILIPHNQNFLNFDTIYIVTEYCDTDLRKLFKLEQTFLQVDDVQSILYQIACGIKYLHSASIIHRDLTPSNILLNAKGMKIKICDLGLARVVQKKEVKQQQAANSSDQEKLQQEVNILSIQEKQAIHRQIFNSYQIIDAQSLPSTPKIQDKCLDPNFEAGEQFIMKRRHTNEMIKINQETGNDLTFSQNLDDLRGSQKSAYQAKATEKKRGKLKRLNSRPLNSNISQNSEDLQKEKFLQLGQKFQKKQEKNKLSSPLAKLTLRVTTRWYRAPEIILLQKGYHKPIDIWSLGCLFAELLKMMKSVCYNSAQRFPLFPGKYCYPVSPATLQNIAHSSKDESSPNYKQDQLFMILSTIGKPNQEDMSFLTDEAAKDYIRQIQDFKRKQLNKIFPSIPKQALQILQNTLLFNPNKRWSIDDILNHPFLQDIKNKDFQKQANPIIMEFQQDQNLTLQILRDYLANEIKNYF